VYERHGTSSRYEDNILVQRNDRCKEYPLVQRHDNHTNGQHEHDMTLDVTIHRHHHRGGVGPSSIHGIISFQNVCHSVYQSNVSLSLSLSLSPSLSLALLCVGAFYVCPRLCVRTDK